MESRAGRQPIGCLRYLALAAALSLPGCAAYYTFLSGGYEIVPDSEPVRTRRIAADMSTMTTRWEITFGQRDSRDAIEVARSQSKSESIEVFMTNFNEEFRRRSEQALKNQRVCDGSVTLFGPAPISTNSLRHRVDVECHHVLW